MARAVIIADDLTGANVTGALLRKNGYRFATFRHGVPVGPEVLADYDAVAVSTDSRGIGAGAAYDRVKRTAQAFVCLLYTSIGRIVDLMMAELQKRLDDKRIVVKLSEDAKEAVIDQGYDPSYGARPLKRFLQKNIETMIGKEIIRGNLDEDQVVTVDFKDGHFVIEK